MSQMVSRIMNEDVVEEVLRHLQFRQLFQIQNTSKQFCFCVKRLLRRKKCLNFGEMNEWILCEDFSHRSEQPLLGLRSSVKMSSQNIIPIVWKCPNIRCLYLNQVLGLETIELMADICERLECLCFGNTFLNSQSNQLKTIGLLFADRVIHLSIECYFQEENIDGKVIELIRHFTSLQNLRVIHFKPLNNTLNFVSKHLKSLRISCTPFWFTDSLGDGDITSLINFIKRNDRCLNSLHINDYHISEQLLALICSYLDLKQLSISCKLLPLSSLIQTLSKSQHNLSFLALNGLSLEDILMVSLRNDMKVKCLRLISCHFEVKSFIRFLNLFQFLEEFEFSGLYFRCECNPTNNEITFFCPKCNQKCLTELSKSKTLKVLKMNVMLNDVCPVWHSLTRISRLEKLKVQNISRFDCKHLAKNLIEVLSEKTSKYFTLEFNGSLDKSLFIKELYELCHQKPRNLRIIY